MRSSPSSVRRPRPLVSVPVAAQSGARIAPMPKAGKSRPSLSTSMVAHCLASSSGSRSPTRGDVHAELDPLGPPGKRRHHAHHFEEGLVGDEAVGLPQRIDPALFAEVDPAPEGGRTRKRKRVKPEADGDRQRCLPSSMPARADAGGGIEPFLRAASGSVQQAGGNRRQMATKAVTLQRKPG